MATHKNVNCFISCSECNKEMFTTRIEVPVTRICGDCCGFVLTDYDKIEKQLKEIEQAFHKQENKNGSI